MTWTWSHTQAAYIQARENVHKLPRPELEEIWEEWHGEPAPDNLADDMLADEIWNKMSTARRCDNGGWNAYACPTGCHTVPFSNIEQDPERE